LLVGSGGQKVNRKAAARAGLQQQTPVRTWRSSVHLPDDGKKALKMLFIAWRHGLAAGPEVQGSSADVEHTSELLPGEAAAASEFSDRSADRHACAKRRARARLVKRSLEARDLFKRRNHRSRGGSEAYQDDPSEEGFANLPQHCAGR
jgi:hypothetical protein